MRKHSYRTSYRLVWVALALLALSLAACSKQAAANQQKAFLPVINQGQSSESYSDPFAYCAAVGTIDQPDARYTGAQVPDEIIQGYKTAAGLENSSEPLEQFQKSTIWRCMDGKVYACNFGANLPCDSKANTDKNPTQAMTDYCQQNANSDFIPMSVTGHETVYSWRCNQETPAVDKQISSVDAAGYIADIWYPLAKNP